MEVRPSTVHGLGVFTTKSFKEGDLVCRYSGDCLRNVTGNESKYILQLQWYNSGEGRPEVWYLDSSGLDNFCGRYINDARHTPLITTLGTVRSVVLVDIQCVVNFSRMCTHLWIYLVG